MRNLQDVMNFVMYARELPEKWLKLPLCCRYIAAF